MCGIFGFVGVAGTRWDNRLVQAAVREFIRLSERRGREAAGLAITLPSEIAVYKRAMRPSDILRSRDFAEFLGGALPGDGSYAETHGVTVVGHCRLVTNGTQALHRNNQPVLFDGGLGIHNGIITNAAALGVSGSNGRIRLLDSEVLFNRIGESFAGSGDIRLATRRTFQNLEGEASVAFLHDETRSLLLATNSGSLYHCSDPPQQAFAFASERRILEEFLHSTSLLNGGGRVEQLEPGSGMRIGLETVNQESFSLLGDEPLEATAGRPGPLSLAVRDYSDRRSALRRCRKCVLPETYPFIEFDTEGVCNYCHEHVTQVVRGREALLHELERHRRGDGNPDCIVAFSGGRDSSYGLHLLKTELGMTPLAFTYDWGLVTDIARRNQARICGKLGIEHIIRAADIPRQRRYLRKNIEAWLARPRLGMIPLFMAGDKFFYQHARDLRRETGVNLVVFCAGNELERTQFKAGFAGVRENNYSNRLFGLAPVKKLQLAWYYLRQFALNPRYLNESLLNSLLSFHSTFVAKDDFLYLYNYEPWDETRINTALIEKYNWETASNSQNTWRIGDGYTSFINYIYHKVAGFSEYDAFRSNQVRDGILTRDQALALIESDNQPRMEDLSGFARLIGFNLEEALARIDRVTRVQ